MAKPNGILVVFDLVSTLADAGPRYVQAFAEVLESSGHGAVDPAEVLSMLGNKNLSEITDHFAGDMGPGEKQQFMAACNNTCDLLLTRPGWTEQLYPNVREAIETMRLRGTTLGIYTGTREDALDKQLAYHDLNDMFDARYLRGNANVRDAGKTNTALKAEQLGTIVEAFRADNTVLPAANENISVVVIGDSKADADAAENLGLYFIGFAVDDTKRQALEAAGVRRIVSDFGDLPDLIQRLHSSPANDLAPRPGHGKKLVP